MNWGKSIILAFVLFAMFIAVLVTVCVRQDVSLVTKDYYRDELAYEDQLTRMRNAAALAIPPSFTVDKNGNLEIQFDRFKDLSGGELYLFCPSDSKQDRRFTLSDGTSMVRQFSLANTPHGMYKARMSWRMDGKDFFVEHLITI